MLRALGVSAVVGLAFAGVVFPADAAERGRGLPFRGADAHCIAIDHKPRAARGDFRWFVASLARSHSRDDGCRVEQMSRFGQAEAWRVRLSCAGGTVFEHWMLNYDGSVTMDRAGRKATLRPCEHGQSD